MLNERHTDILKIVSLRRRVTVSELTERLGVSEVTIRKDLGILESMGYLVRTRGAAVLAEDREHRQTLGMRRNERIEAKRAIAARAVELVSDGDTIYLDSGSTCAALAELLVTRNLRVVTNSIDVMLILGEAPGIALYAVGGSYRKEAGSFIGPLALESLSSFHIETAFVGATGISPDGVFSAQNLIEAELKRAVVRASRRAVFLADRSKIGSEAFADFARPNDVDLLVTDAPVRAPVVSDRSIASERSIMSERPGESSASGSSADSVGSARPGESPAPGRSVESVGSAPADSRHQLRPGVDIEILNATVRDVDRGDNSTWRLM